MSNASDKSAMIAALSTLERCMKAMYFQLDLPEFDNTALEAYFNCDNPEEIAYHEKCMAMAAVEAIYNDPYILPQLKERAARKAARDFQHSMRAAKTEYEFRSGKYGKGTKARKEYGARILANHIVQKVAIFDTIKKGVNKVVNKVKNALNQVADTVAEHADKIKPAAKEAVITAVEQITGKDIRGPIEVAKMVVSIIPDKVKEKFEEVKEAIVDEAKNVVNRVADAVVNSAPVQTAKQIVNEKVIPAVQKAGVAIKEFGNKAWSNIKAIFA